MVFNTVPVQESIRIGDGYELDLRLRRLRRGNHTIKLEHISLEILVLLVEHPGEVVNRDAIVVRIWGKGVFLDTDNCIRGAIRKLRQALKDDAESPASYKLSPGRVSLHCSDRRPGFCSDSATGRNAPAGKVVDRGEAVALSGGSSLCGAFRLDCAGNLDGGFPNSSRAQGRALYKIDQRWSEKSQHTGYRWSAHLLQ